jgi:DNA-binding response OmpR family regulator
MCFNQNLKQIQSTNNRSPLILVIEDDEDNLVFISYALIFLNYTFITAKDAQTALSLIKTYQPSLILLDIILPKINGLELVHDLRHGKLTSQTPIIAVTALATESDRDRILAAGCNDYLCKPYFIDELNEKISAHLPQQLATF